MDDLTKIYYLYKNDTHKNIQNLTGIQIQIQI